MNTQEIEKHVEEGIALVDTKTSLFLKAIYHTDDEEVRTIMCNSPSQAHIFTNAQYLEDFIEESGLDPLTRRRAWLRVKLSRTTQVIGSLAHLY